MDPIHGLIDLHPLLVKIIDTPEFQRLRNIKQLGMCYYVYPGASHNRFEHSIGVCHLAGRFVRELKAKLKDDDGEVQDADGKVQDADENVQYADLKVQDTDGKVQDIKGKVQDADGKVQGAAGEIQDAEGEVLKLEVTDEEVLCVEIAGLCHDLGHGPFSHAFDKTLVKDIIEKEGDRIQDKTFGEHEERSVAVLQQLIKEKTLGDLFEQYKISKADIDFIGELITASARKDTEKWTFKGRLEEKAFLYEIVSNVRNSIDVDKWDYFARDCHMLGIKNDFNHNRCIQFARVVMVKGRSYICYRDKEVHNLYEMFHTRFNLHVRAYQHKTTKILDHEVAQVLYEIREDEDFKINGKTLKQLIVNLLNNRDVADFCLLTDDILSEILRKPDGTCEKAKKRIKKIFSRKFPHLVGQTLSLTVEQETTLGKDVEELKKDLIGTIVNSEDVDVVVLPVILDYGKKGENPIDCVYFYKKNAPNNTFHIKREEVSLLLPDKFSETKVRVYCRGNKDQCDALAVRFMEWCKEKGYPLPKG